MMNQCRQLRKGIAPQRQNLCRELLKLYLRSAGAPQSDAASMERLNIHLFLLQKCSTYGAMKKLN